MKKAAKFNSESMTILLVVLSIHLSAQPNPNYHISDTGQIICYSTASEIRCPVSGDSFYGQDTQSRISELHDIVLSTRCVWWI